MARGLDHIVHAVRDLDAAADLYRRLGFTVGGRNRHPWGTHNHIVQLPGFYIELLTLAEPEKLGNDGFSTMFAAYNRDFTARGEGFSLLILESKDARADATTFSAANIAASQDLRFERDAKRPDGSSVKVGFSLAFAEDKAARDIHFAACQQHFPENFWNPVFQRHPNGVMGVGGVVVVADQPEEHRQFFEVFADASAVARDGDLVIATPRGMIEVVSPAAFLHRFGVKPPGMARGARLAALRLVVTQPSRLQALPELAGIAGLYVGNDAIIGSEDAMGAILVFERSAQKPR
jgi:catechol 2,3-dioxygenase-like lactoylglutathione lyase family enzyme